MNGNRIVQMVIRLVMRRLIGRGIGAGIDRATRGRPQGSRPQGSRQQGERQQGGGGDGARTGPPPGGGTRARATKRALRLARRFGRF
ncbi:hypothetical protein [Rhodosalinus sp.]|uniref:hypothetical protein n=1 Tax=Rhodosalinus sp. TaxID=2047741 RepID=UPI003563A5EB